MEGLNTHGVGVHRCRGVRQNIGVSLLQEVPARHQDLVFLLNLVGETARRRLVLVELAREKSRAGDGRPRCRPWVSSSMDLLPLAVPPPMPPHLSLYLSFFPQQVHRKWRTFKSSNSAELTLPRRRPKVCWRVPWVLLRRVGVLA